MPCSSFGKGRPNRTRGAQKREAARKRKERDRSRRRRAARKGR